MLAVNFFFALNLTKFPKNLKIELKNIKIPIFPTLNANFTHLLVFAKYLSEKKMKKNR